MACNGYDYDSAKVDALKGMNLSEVGRKHNIPYAALQQYARRHKWMSDKTRVRQVLENHFADETKSWVAKLSTRAHAVMDALNTYDFQPGKLKPMEWLQAVDTLDRIFRRAHGMDKVEASKPASLTINMAVTAGTDAAPVGKVIDVDGAVVADASDKAPKQIS